MRRWLQSVKDWNCLVRAAGFSARKVASGLEISQRQLQRHFRDVYHLEFRKWMTSVRLDDARHLLAHRRQVKEVAFLLGYKQANHFSREFKRMFGITPEQFAHSHPLGNPQVEDFYSELKGRNQ